MLNEIFFISREQEPELRKKKKVFHTQKKHFVQASCSRNKKYLPSPILRMGRSFNTTLGVRLPLRYATGRSPKFCFVVKSSKQNFPKLECYTQLNFH